jgi:hypothetical protein
VKQELQRRIGRNEGLFRRVNEAILRGLWPESPERVVAFRCECARLDCNAPVRTSVATYERVRAHPRRFLLVPGHEMPSVEIPVENGSGYLVVEKIQIAGEVAEDIDPRS